MDNWWDKGGESPAFTIKSPLTGEVCGRPMFQDEHGKSLPGLGNWFIFHETGFKRMTDWVDTGEANFGKWACADCYDLLMDNPRMQAWLKGKIYSHNYGNGIPLFDTDDEMAAPQGYVTVALPDDM